MTQPQDPKTLKGPFDDVEEFKWHDDLYPENAAEGLKKDIIRHVVSSIGSDWQRTRPFNFYRGLALSVRDRLIDLWIKTQRSHYDQEAKRVYYLSLEYLPGRSLAQNLHSLNLYDTARNAMTGLGQSLDEAKDMERDAGLGNGGLGRLASCYLESMASLGIPAWAYGIRYDYGIFYQRLENGYQVEESDHWMRWGDVWQFVRSQHIYEVKFSGKTEVYVNEQGKKLKRWVETDNVMAIACDFLVPGYRNENVLNMRLWTATSSREFDLKYFNTGNYIGSVEAKVRSENISKVLYPSEQVMAGKELRLKQQYFFCCATLQDIIRRFKKTYTDFNLLPDKVVIQLNETHPAIAIPELMRMLLDEEGLPWNKAWDICQRTFAYTNHTILPEALETWPVDLLGRLLPRHLEIIFEINQHFLEFLEKRYPGDLSRRINMSLIQEGPERKIRMAYLAIAGSFSVNGVSALHTEILKKTVFKVFYDCFPEKFNNKTNGITPRLWLHQANRPLSKLINRTLGKHWVNDLEELSKLKSYADDPGFHEEWKRCRAENKNKLLKLAKENWNVEIDPQTMFDVHVKRIHEYKRQLMNVLHVLTLYNHIKDNPNGNHVPRTVMFGGKAAPGYYIAKLIIKLIHSTSELINNDPAVNKYLKVLFLTNYSVSLAETIIPATDLSEQISTAGMEASGTGNMKFALNGALTIGTMDGANIEMCERIGKENMFIFGHLAEELDILRTSYNPFTFYESNVELKRVIDMIATGLIKSNSKDLFQPILDSLLFHGDRFFVLADYQKYVTCQEQVSRLFLDQKEWTRRSILNTANMGWFSSDRSVKEYARDIWKVKYQER